jgi:hypothetical protein
MVPRPPRSTAGFTPVPYPALCRSDAEGAGDADGFGAAAAISDDIAPFAGDAVGIGADAALDVGDLDAEGAGDADGFGAAAAISDDIAPFAGDTIGIGADAALDAGAVLDVGGLDAEGAGDADGIGAVAADDASPPIATEGPHAAEMLEIAHDDIAQLIEAEATGAETETEINLDLLPLDAPQAIDDEPIQDAPSANDETAAVALAGGTVRLTPEDILAALTSTASAANMPEAPATEENLPDDASSAQNADTSAAAETAEPGPTLDDQPKAAAVAAEPANNEASKIKVRMGAVLMEQLTIEEVAAMAEEGKLEEHHLVARQFSENWIEAPKVPVLRPIYERLRRNRQPQAAAPPTTKAPAPKGGLFGRLFGRN